MNLNEYQDGAMKTAIYPRLLEKLDNKYYDSSQSTFQSGGWLPIYPALKLAGESGEVAEKIGKALRDGIPIGGAEEWRQGMKKELGDVLWYVAAIARDLGFTLDEVAEGNLDKLRSRQERGVLQGSGDNR